jgi:hypothetical protein
MAGLGQPAVDRLRQFLRDLKPGARALLIAELERSLLRGDDIAGAELILTELRRSFRASGSNTPRITDPARLFFQPLEPFLVDDGPNHQHRGRLARSALEPIWLWIANGLMADEVKMFSAQVEQALIANDSENAEKLARSFQDRAVQAMRAALAAVEGDDKARRRLGAQIGTPRALQDVEAVIGVLSARDALSALGAKLPGHIRSLIGAQLESVKALLDMQIGGLTNLFTLSLVLVMSRLAAPWQLIRLATKAAGGDSAARIIETPYALAVAIVLAEIERMVDELASDLKSSRAVAVIALLKDVHDTVRGLRSELDLSVDSEWGRQLAAVRTKISTVLSGEIELMPGRVRRLLRPRPPGEISSGSVLDLDEVADTEAMVGFVAACRSYAGELAISEVTTRAFYDLQQQLDTGTHALLDALRSADDNERAFRQSQVDAAVRFCAKVFGQEYASLLAKAAEVASQGERKVAAKA